MTGTASSLRPEYVAARTVLLNALDALRAHRPALIVVGAQAVYLRTGSAGMTISPYTTDGDLALDPTLLGDDPLLEAAMEQRGFRLYHRGDGGIEPGTWIGTTEVNGRIYEVPVDLIVPEAVLTGGKTRGARLPAHGKRAAKRTHGLEAALVDKSSMTLPGLAPDDHRAVDITIAGVAALLVAKVHKLRDRVADGRVARLRDKDAGDVLRLIRATPVAAMADRLQALVQDPIAGAVTHEALIGLGDLFGTPNSTGITMAVDAVQLDLPADLVEVQLTEYVRALRRRLGPTVSGRPAPGSGPA